MKSTRVNATERTAIAARAAGSGLAASAQSGAMLAAPYELLLAFAQINALKRALEASQEESNAARQQNDVFMETISRLRQKVMRLEHEAAQLHHFAYHDELTGLPNRSLLLDRLNQAIVQASRQQKQVGVLLLDLDGFKSVNDKFGHETGDKLLQRVAERLLCCIRDADTACRYGGDEFVVLLPDVDGEKSTAEVAQKIRLNLANPYLIDDHSIALTASIGIAVYPYDGNNQDDLIRRADIAMYLAKAHNNPQIPTLQPAAQN